MKYVYILQRLPFWWDERNELQFGWPQIKGAYTFREDAIAKIPRGYQKHGRNTWRHEKLGYLSIIKKKVD